ncbi:MAG: late competence development ComFB family protein [Steroidobacteraceae bacterium]|jgi:hypothetical protein
MFTQFESVHNSNEEAIFGKVLDAAPGYPKLAGDPELLADVACVALNRLPPRYIRHKVDMDFYMSADERRRREAAVKAAVEFAFGFVQSRLAARG